MVQNVMCYFFETRCIKNCSKISRLHEIFQYHHIQCVAEDGWTWMYGNLV